MATATSSSCVDQIGASAGLVWRALNDNGPLSYARLVKQTKLHRDVVMQAIGWLAREDKVEIDDTSRGKVISLKDDDADA